MPQARATHESTRVEDIWLSDGSLVVRAEKSIFRFSGAVLAARSSVFQDMLSFHRPGPGQRQVERIEGVPVLVLYDLAVEVEPFLRALYDSKWVSLSIGGQLGSLNAFLFEYLNTPAVKSSII